MLLAALLAPEAGSGLAYFREQRFAAAERAFRADLTRKSKDAITRLYLARTLIELKRTPEALAEIERVLAGAVTPETRFQAGRILRELAERHFSQLQSVAPESAPSLELAGVRFERSGDLDEALRLYRAAAALDSKRPGVHYRIGNVLWRKRDLDTAFQELTKERALTPHHGMANLRLGQILMNGDRAQEALPYLERSLAAMPGSIEVRREIGKAYRKTGQTAEARKHWEAVAKARPDDDQIHYLLAGLYGEIGESALAQRELEVHRGILARRRQRAGQR